MVFTIEDVAVTQQMNKLWGMPSIGCKDIILCFSLTNRLEEYVEEREGKIHDLQSKYVFFFCYSGGCSSNFVEFHLGKCQFKDKGNAEVNFAVHVCSKCDSLVYVYSNF